MTQLLCCVHDEAPLAAAAVMMWCCAVLPVLCVVCCCDTELGSQRRSVMVMAMDSSSFRDRPASPDGGSAHSSTDASSSKPDLIKRMPRWKLRLLTVRRAWQRMCMQCSCRNATSWSFVPRTVGVRQAHVL